MARRPGIEPFVQRVAAAVRRVAPEFGLVPTPTDRFVTAHAILSTGWFDDDLSQLHNGVFGVKAGSSWTGAVALLPTGECYTPAEVARAQSIPAGQRGSFIRYANGHCPPGKVKVLIWDAFRKYGSIDEAIRDHLRGLTNWKKSDGTLRYARSLALLRAGDLRYMHQLGYDGWYTGDPAVAGPAWQNITTRGLPPILMSAGGPVEAGTSNQGAILLILGLGAGWWWTHRRRR